MLNLTCNASRMFTLASVPTTTGRGMQVLEAGFRLRLRRKTDAHELEGMLVLPPFGRPYCGRGKMNDN
jgi:hypothetical protein